MSQKQQNTAELRTRYPGLASFTTAQKDLFFGRKQETRELSNLIAVERTVVLFSKSGYGKTSLLQAGVMPLLYGQMMVPVPVRFGTDALRPEQHFSIALDTAWHRFQGKTEGEAQKSARDTSGEESFWAQIARSPFGAGAARFEPLFIFDQFEELFTLYPDPQQRARFVQELADLIHERQPAALRERILADLDAGKITDAAAADLELAPPMRFVFSIRSDMLHFMDELSEAIPYILRSRYQLFGLSDEQAREAMVAPAGLPGAGFASPAFGYDDAALGEILSVLSKNREVESFQLQAVCQAIEEKMIKHESGTSNHGSIHSSSLIPHPQVTSAFYGGREGIDHIIEENYNKRLESLDDLQPGWTQLARRLLEDVLVNKNNRRQSVDVVELAAPPALLDELERQRLLRKEPRLDSFYYEISHDTWLAPILKGRKLRLEAEERERIAREKADAERRRRRAFLASAVAGVLILGAVGLIVFAVKKTRDLELEKERAEIASRESYEANRFAERKKVEAEKSELKAIQKETAAKEAKQLAENAQKLAALKTKDAKSASDLAEIKKLEAAQAELKAKALLEASKFLAFKKLPENFDALIPFDSLDFSIWGLIKISSDIGKLQNLQWLDLGYNQLSILPAEIWNLQNLKWLNLRNNQFYYLPSEIGNLQNLQWLNLMCNHLSSNLPSEIGNLQNLQHLYLNRNYLISFPDEIVKLQNLQSLDLNWNRLDSLPVEIGNLQNLQSLDLSNNKLSSLPAEIGKLQNLKSLNLSGNNLCNLPIDVLKQMPNLYRITLQEKYSGGNPLKKEDIEALRRAMPWCKIVWEE